MSARIEDRARRREAKEFRDRVFAGCLRHGITVEWTPFGEDSARLVAWRPYGLAQELLLTGIDGSSALTESGSPVCAADVVCALRRLVERRST